MHLIAFIENGAEVREILKHIGADYLSSEADAAVTCSKILLHSVFCVLNKFVEEDIQFCVIINIAFGVPQ